MLSWKIKAREFDLKFTWKISRGSTDKKVNYFVQVSDQDLSALGEVAGITQDDAAANIILNEFKKTDLSKVRQPEDIAKLEISSPLKFGLESALIHLECKKLKINVAEYFKLEKLEKIPTSFSLPILPISKIGDFIEAYNVKKFPFCKIKVGHEKQKESCLQVAKYYDGPLRVDANEAFKTAEEALQFIKDIEHLDLQFLEQPLPRAKVDEYLKLKQHSPVPIIADESLQTQDIDEDLVKQFHGINVKLMKSGGYTQAVKQIKQAKAMDLKVMLGCMVETSLAIHGAYSIGQDVDWFDLDGFLFFKDEPFQLVEEKEGYLYSLE